MSGCCSVHRDGIKTHDHIFQVSDSGVRGEGVYIIRSTCLICVVARHFE